MLARDQPHAMSLAPPMGQAQEGGVATCHLCNKTFTGRYQKYNLKRHLSIHAGQKPFSCPFCHHRTNQKYNMQQHLLVCRRRPSLDAPPPGQAPPPPNQELPLPNQEPLPPPQADPWAGNPNANCTS